MLRAAAWLDGASAVTPDVFPVLANVLWDLPDQRGALVKMVAKYTSAELAEAQDIFDAMAALLAELPAKGAEDYATKVSGVTREIKRAGDKIAGLEKATANSPAGEKINTLRKELERRYVQVRKDAAEALGL